MQIRHHKSWLLTGLLLAAVMVSSSAVLASTTQPAVYAEGGTTSGIGDRSSTEPPEGGTTGLTSNQITSHETEQGDSTSSGDKPGVTNSDSSEGQGEGKLASVKLKVCQNRQAAINRILNHIVTRGQNQLNLFNTIAQRVETFATSKNVTVANYDQLVATLQADQTKAQSDLAAMKANDTLDCTSSDPKGMVDAFKADLQLEISDLKTYKTDVKNLIVAVKTAVGSSTNNTSDDKTSTTTGGTQ